MELSDTKQVSLALPWVEADKTESLPSIPLELDLGHPCEGETVP